MNVITETVKPKTPFLYCFYVMDKGTIRSDGIMHSMWLLISNHKRV